MIFKNSMSMKKYSSFLLAEIHYFHTYRGQDLVEGVTTIVIFKVIKQGKGIEVGIC